MKKLEVKYLGVVVGYTYGEGSTIEFLDNELAKQVLEKINSNNKVGLSSRRMGLIKEDNKIEYNEITEYGIII